MTALLPPSSRMERPKRFATATATRSPMVFDPVAETSGMRPSLISASPTSEPLPTTRLKTPSNPLPSITRRLISVTATADSGTSLEGFQIHVSPHTAAMKEFHDQTLPGS